MIAFGIFVLAILVVALMGILVYTLDERRMSKERLAQAQIERAPSVLMNRTMQLIAATLAEDALTPFFSTRQREDFSEILVEFNNQQRELTEGSR